MAKPLFEKNREEHCEKCGELKTFTLKDVGNFSQRTIMIALKVFMGLLILALAVSALSFMGYWPVKVRPFDVIINITLLALVIFGHNNMLSKAVGRYQCTACNTVMEMPSRGGS